MMRLKSKLLSLNADKAVKVKVYTPANCDEVRIPFKKDKIAKVVGKLAELASPSEEDDAQLMAGVLVQNGFNLSLMAPDDLQEYAGLTTTTITCKQHITLSSASMDLIRWALEGTFGAIEEVGSSKKAGNSSKNKDTDLDMIEDETSKQEEAEEEVPAEETRTFLVMGCVYLRHYSRSREVELEWEGNMMNDGVADAVMAVLLTVESSPASVKRKKLHITHSSIPMLTISIIESAKDKHHHHHHDEDDTGIPSLPNAHAQAGPQERLARMLMMLEAQFGGDNIGPIERPRVPTDLALGPQNDGEEINDERFSDIEAAELNRLIAMGIPVPGIEIKVDKHVARVWLEDLEVECTNAVLRDRIRVVVERAIETVAGLWAEGPISREVEVNGSTKAGIESAAAKKAAVIETEA
jgi:cleavage and polyadenylation specificity factor subunit 3